VKRFWDKVDKTGECWIWTASKYLNGYGQFRFDGKNWGAHRMAWLLTNGEIPDGMLVCHTCDNPSCIRPAHLFIGTQKQNMRDCIDKGRQYRAYKTHCKHGHEFTVDNTYICTMENGVQRSCRTCNRAKANAHNARKRTKIINRAQLVSVGGVN